MRKFFIHSHKGSTSILEIEIRKLGGLDDPSVMWLQPGEFKVKVLSPASLLEKTATGQVVHPNYYSHSIYDSVEDAKIKLTQQLTDAAVREFKKHGTPYSDQEILDRVSSIEIKML